MKRKEDYELDERVALIEEYRKNGKHAGGTESALKWYQQGIAYALKGEEYARENYEYYYFTQKHCRSYERKGKAYFEKAASCFERSAELGHELGMMNYALYLYAFKDEYAKALPWFIKASEAGLAVADYELAVFYKNGYCGVEVDKEKAEAYFQRYQTRCAEDERQLILAWDLDNDWRVLGRSYMFNWFCGYSFPECYDTPRVKPSKWKYRA